MRWTAADLPDVSGLTVLVTGASSGLGEAMTIALATRGAHVILATRDAAKTEAVMERIRTRHPDASLEQLPLDLADLDSVRAAGETALDRHASIDRVVANAGIMAPPQQRTSDGSELQIGVNHLGHFALVGYLLPALLAAPQARVVTISSVMHRGGRLDLTDLHREREPYDRWEQYRASKLANLLYLLELHRRLGAAETPAIAVGAHPGYTATALQSSGPGMGGGAVATTRATVLRTANLLVAQSTSRGVLPQLYAATAPEVPAGSYWGPDGPGEMRGYPAPASRSDAARDTVLARDLWDVSEELTGVSYALP